MALHGYTAHMKPGREPVLLREGFSWGAFLLGPIWLLVHRAWIPALIEAALLVATATLLHATAPFVGFAIALLAGLTGRDLVRWSLEYHGYELLHVLAARDEEAALARLLTYRPETAVAMAGLLP